MEDGHIWVLVFGWKDELGDRWLQQVWKTTLDEELS
jgi:hypothetical protein